MSGNEHPGEFTMQAERWEYHATIGWLQTNMKRLTPHGWLPLSIPSQLIGDEAALLDLRV
jgi:hypothetical protein